MSLYYHVKVLKIMGVTVASYLESESIDSEWTSCLNCLLSLSIIQCRAFFKLMIGTFMIIIVTRTQKMKLSEEK